MGSSPRCTAVRMTLEREQSVLLDHEVVHEPTVGVVGLLGGGQDLDALGSLGARLELAAGLGVKGRWPGRAHGSGLLPHRTPFRRDGQLRLSR